MDTDVVDSFNFLLGREYGKYLDLAAQNEKLTEKGDGQEEAEFHQSLLDICTSLITVHLRRYINPPKVHVAFLESPTLGAVVILDKQTGDYFIGLYFGSVVVLRAFFATLLTSPKVLPWLGDVKMEDAVKMDNLFLTNMIDVLEFLFAYPEKRVRPNDGMRTNIAQHMTSYAMQFLVMHELGHIVRGHIAHQVSKIKGSGTGNMFIDSTAEELTAEKQVNLEKQALEFDADVFAAFHGVAASYQLAGSIDSKEKKQALQVWVSSIYSLFRLMSSKRSNTTDLINYTHPPAGLRMIMSLDLAGGQMQNLGEEIFGRKATKEEISEIINNCMRNVEEGIVDISSDLDLTLKDYTIMYSAAAAEVHKRSILGIIDNLFNSVEEFKLEFVNP
jgi:hypothetical protein